MPILCPATKARLNFCESKGFRKTILWVQPNIILSVQIFIKRTWLLKNNFHDPCCLKLLKPVEVTFLTIQPTKSLWVGLQEDSECLQFLLKGINFLTATLNGWLSFIAPKTRSVIIIVTHCSSQLLVSEENTYCYTWHIPSPWGFLACLSCTSNFHPWRDYIWNKGLAWKVDSSFLGCVVLKEEGKKVSSLKDFFLRNFSYFSFCFIYFLYAHILLKCFAVDQCDLIFGYVKFLIKNGLHYSYQNSWERVTEQLTKFANSEDLPQIFLVKDEKQNCVKDGLGHSAIFCLLILAVNPSHWQKCPVSLH